MYIGRLYCDRKQMAIYYVIWIADADIHVRVVKSTNTYNMGSWSFACVFMVKMTKLLKVNDTDFMFD